MGTKGQRSSGIQYNPKGATQGNTLVDPYTGLPIDVITDGDGKRRLCVDAKINATIDNLNVDLDYQEDSVHIGDPNTNTTLKINPDGTIDVNVSLDANTGDNVAISGHSQQVFAENASTINNAIYNQIFSYTSTSNNTNIIKVECSISTPATIRLKIGTSIKRVLRSSPLERNVVFQFSEPRPLLNGEIISIEAQVERLILVSYDTFTSLEGYIR